MSSPQQKLKILALHGHAMSGELLKAKIGAIRQDTKKVAEWFFPDAPILIPNADAFFHKDASKTSSSSPPPLAPAATASSTEEQGGRDDAKTEEQEQQPMPSVYSWYDFSKVSHAVSAGLDLHKPCAIDEVSEPMYSGMDDALKYLGKYVDENGPFDVIFSFSQGTILAALMVCQLNYNRASLQVGGSSGGASVNGPTLSQRLPQIPSLLNQPIKAAIFASGLPAKDPYFTQILKDPAFASLEVNSTTTTTTTTPTMPISSLHLWGLSDDIISPEWSTQLMGYPVFCGGGDLEGGEVGGDGQQGGVKEDVKLEHSFKKTCPSGLVQYAYHDGGHVVASTLRKPIKAFLQGLMPAETVEEGGKQKKQGKQQKKEKKPTNEQQGAATTNPNNKSEEQTKN